MRNGLGIVLFVASVLGVGVAIGRVIPGGPDGPPRAPLEGVLVHDFGSHMMNETMLKLEHTFELRNAGKRTLQILDIISTCGCAIAALDTRTVPPGATLALPVTLTLQEPVRRSETIWIQLAGYESAELQVVGAAQRVQDITAAHLAVLLKPEEEKTILLIATDHATDFEPPRPRLAAPPGVEAEAGAWRRLFGRDAAKGRPARWEAIVTVRRIRDALPRGSKLRIHFDPEPVLEIDLTGRPWARDPAEPPLSNNTVSENGDKERD